MSLTSDTIVAIASAPGRGAVGVIRVSGPGVPQIAESILGAPSAAAPRAGSRISRRATANGSTADWHCTSPLPLPIPANTSWNCKAMAARSSLDLLLKRLLELGCRMARPGEFSERAFLNGKIDIAQAEAIADLIDAGSTAAARAAVRSMQGEFSARVHELQAQITELRTLVEAAIDFPDEELDFVPGSVWAIASRSLRRLRGRSPQRRAKARCCAKA